MIRWTARVAFVFLVVGLLSGDARAADAPPLVHPIFAHLPDAPETDTARQTFTAAATHYGLRPVEVVDVPAAAPPRAGDNARIGILNAQKMAFGEAQHDLDTAAAEVAATGGAGLDPNTLSDLYLYRAMVTAHADWKAQAADAATDARTHAFDDYLRAATITPTREPNARELPPQAVADFRRALDEVHKRPRGTLLVRGPSDGQVSLDGGALMTLGGGVTFRELPYGEHLLRVEQIGFAPWGTAVPFGQPTMQIDVPARAPLALDDATAAAHARRMGARFALVAQAKGGPGAPVEITLIDVGSGARRDAAQVQTVGEAGQVDAAVFRLDEEARRIALEQPVPPGAPPAFPTTDGSPPLLLTPAPVKTRFSDDPAAWARDHWPLLTAIGVVALTAVVLGATVASDHK